MKVQAEREKKEQKNGDKLKILLMKSVKHTNNNHTINSKYKRLRTISHQQRTHLNSVLLNQNNKETMGSHYYRSLQDQKTKTNFYEKGLIQTLKIGFNNFAEVIFPQMGKTRRVKTTTGTILQQHQNQSLLADLQDKKMKLKLVSTQVDILREHQFSEYIRKSQRYQQLLNINQDKKKRLPTLNSKVGQIIKKPAQFVVRNGYYQLIEVYQNIQGWKPQSRQGHTALSYGNNIIIIGGHCSIPFNGAHVYDMQTHQWIKHIKLSTSRSYHSSILYKDRFIVTFGGMGNYDISRKCRNCYNSVYLLDLLSWSCRSMKMNGQDNIEPRRSHAASLLSKHMVVFGGINSKKQFLKDLLFLDLKQLRWYAKQYKCESQEIEQYLNEGIGKHKGISIFKQRKSLPLYSNDYQDYQGIYYFGGFNGLGEQNVVIQLVFTKYMPTFVKVDYSGHIPSSAQMSANLISDNVVLLLSGQLHNRQVRLFKVKQKIFNTVQVISDLSVIKIIGSPLCKWNDNYYMFFGLGPNGYINNPRGFTLNQKFKQQPTNKKKVKSSFPSWRDFDQDDTQDQSSSSRFL